MQVLITAATETELAGLEVMAKQGKHQINCAVHGPGLLSATYRLTRLLKQPPDVVLQIGVAGSFREDLQPGDVVAVAGEQLGDLGAEDHEQFLSLFDLGLLHADDIPFRGKHLPNPYTHLWPDHLPAVQGLTVNLCAGHQRTVENRKAMGADIETMEGAALHYVALLEGIPFLQIRGISNRVEPRNRETWRIPEALSACHREVLHLLNQWI